MPNQKRTSLEDAAKRLRASAVIAIVLPEHPDLIVIGSAHALDAGLRTLGKVVSVFAAPSLGSTALAAWAAPGEENEPLREFIISLDLTRSPIKELRYERAENRLNIILSPTGSRIRRDDVEFRYGPLRYDLVITLGIPALDDAQASVRASPELLHEKPILNIDANPANENYGELNLIPKTNEGAISPTIPELIYDLLKSIDALPEGAEPATALFASLAAATHQFHPIHTNAATFHMAADLTERGANPNVVRTSLGLLPGHGAEVRQLMGRAMARSRFDERTGILWLTLTRDDFLKTNAGERDIPMLLERIHAIAPYAVRSVLLWQGGEDAIHIEIACADLASAKEIAARTGLSTIGTRIAVQATAPSFPEAEAAALRLLAPPDAVE